MLSVYTRRFAQFCQRFPIPVASSNLWKKTTSLIPQNNGSTSSGLYGTTTNTDEDLNEEIVDYTPFKDLIVTLEKVSKNADNLAELLSKNSLQLLPDTSPTASGVVANVEPSSPYPTIPGLHSITPALPTKTFSLAPFVNDSPVLRSLVDLGVDLSLVQPTLSSTDIVSLLEFSEDRLAEIVMFLAKEVCIPEEGLGGVLTNNPALLFEDLDNLSVRVQYLRSKQFSSSQIATMIEKYPKLLSRKAAEVDTMLGYIQKIFRLKGVAVRTALTEYPKLVDTKVNKIKMNRTALHQFCDFDFKDLAQMFIIYPKLYTEKMRDILPTFEYLRFTIGFAQQDIVHQPKTLRTRVKRLAPRHQYLVSLARDQYDAEKANYVSIELLTLSTDHEFCEKAAKTTYEQYVEYQKTL